jgi:hypothetical protein
LEVSNAHRKSRADNGQQEARFIDKCVEQGLVEKYAQYTYICLTIGRGRVLGSSGRKEGGINGLVGLVGRHGGGEELGT